MLRIKGEKQEHLDVFLRQKEGSPYVEVWVSNGEQEQKIFDLNRTISRRRVEEPFRKYFDYREGHEYWIRTVIEP